MKRHFIVLLCTVMMTGVTACGKSEPAQSGQTSAAEEDSLGEQETDTDTEEMDMKMTVDVNGTPFTAALEENEAAEALAEMMEQEPVMISLSDYGGFEKVGHLGTDLPTSDRQTTTQAGDIVLYQGNQIVLFYGSNSWRYTRIGHIDDLTGWEQALGSGDVTVTFSVEE